MNKILLTLAAGVAIGLLVAPAKGSETVNKLRDGINDLLDSAKSGVNDMMNAEKEMISNGKKKVADSFM